jgi:hypothetical protein
MMRRPFSKLNIKTNKIMHVERDFFWMGHRHHYIRPPNLRTQQGKSWRQTWPYPSLLLLKVDPWKIISWINNWTRWKIDPSWQ